MSTMNKYMPDGKDESIFAPIQANPLDGNLNGAGGRGRTTEVQSSSKFLRQNLLSHATTPFCEQGLQITTRQNLFLSAFFPK